MATNFNVENDKIVNNLYSENTQTNIVVLNEKSSHPNNFLHNKGEIWVKNTNSTSLFYTDNTYTDYPVSGSGITLVGYTGISDTALGVGAGNKNNITGIDNTAIGSDSLENITIGSDNTAIGFDSAKSITTGTQNVAIGSKALSSAGSDVQNTISIGYQALSITTTSGSVAVGYNALVGQTGASGQQNTAIGYGSLSALQSGAYNTAVGFNSDINAISTTFGTSIGYESNCSGNSSLVIGSSSSSSGANCIILGSNANDNGFSGCILLGANSQGFENNTVSIASSTYPLNTLPATAPNIVLEGWIELNLNGSSSLVYVPFYYKTA